MNALRSIAIAVTVFCVGCAGGPELGKVQVPTQGDLSQVQTLLDKANGLLKDATKREDIEPAMKAFEEVLAIAPEHKDALVAAAMLHFHHGNDVLTEKDKDQRLATWLKGREYALRALGLNPEFRAAYEKDNDMVKQAKLLGEGDAAAAYWAGINWAKWGELYGIIRAAIDIPKVRALLDRVNELTPTYKGNGADRFYTGYWVAIPGFAGRDPKKSTAAYERATKMSPECLANHVTYAWYFARDAEDQALWTSLLQKVVDAPEDPPESPLRLLNSLAKAEAKGYLERTKEIFQ